MGQTQAWMGQGWGMWLSLYLEQTAQECGPPSPPPCPAGPRLPPGAWHRAQTQNDDGGDCAESRTGFAFGSVSLSIPLFLYSSLSLSSHFSLFYFQGLPLFVSENKFSLWRALFSIRLFLSLSLFQFIFTLISLCLCFPISLPVCVACLPTCQPFSVW